MSDSWHDIAEEALEEILEDIDVYKKEELDKIADIGNPEDIIGKPYNQWSQQDIRDLKAACVYDDKPLNDFIMKKEADRVRELISLTKSMEARNANRSNS